ncbi:MAG: thiamine diphosphokinase [Oscillospiraceae bacterium]|nr:thiamine diphosphokinase [Oscillospiraceae bacterium]
MNKEDVCLILAGGPETGSPFLPLPEYAYAICADSGLQLADRLGIKPDWVLGDFDSLGEVPKHLPHMIAPVEKDDTDTMLAVRCALEKGYRDIRIYGAFGGRLDHTFANFQVLEFICQHEGTGMLCGVHDCAYMLKSGGVLHLPKRNNTTLSLFSWSEQCEDVCIRGVHYPLEQGILKRSFPLGVSNEITAEQAEIICGKGLLLVICSSL